VTFRNYPKFPGVFFSWRVILSTDHEKGKQDALFVFSSGKRETVLEYLWLKFLWDQLSGEEFTLFLMTLKDSDHKKWAFLKVLLLKDKKSLRRKLNEIEQHLQIPVSSRERYQGYKRVRVEIQKETRRLPKPTKFSGYVRNISAIGSKSRKTRFLETVTEQIYLDEKQFDWELILTVGEISERE
jgi:hypothetical protein